MHVAILDLDGFSAGQPGLLGCSEARYDLFDWGPRIRMACSLNRWRQFRRRLADCMASRLDDAGVLFIGSGDFHHVTLARLAQLPGEFNLLLIDKHPDWVARIPFLHCGTWLARALELRGLRLVFHVGGELDFDNHYRWLAPWAELKSGRVKVIPAGRRFRAGRWRGIQHEPLRRIPNSPADAARIRDAVDEYADELARRPLYISIDKDVMVESEVVSNWDHGLLCLDEVVAVIAAFRSLAGGRLIGADVTGDYSPFQARGALRNLLAWSEHPRKTVVRARADALNEIANLRLLAALRGKSSSTS